MATAAMCSFYIPKLFLSGQSKALADGADGRIGLEKNQNYA